MLTNEYLDELERLCEAASGTKDWNMFTAKIPALVAEVRRLSEWQPIETAPGMEDCQIYSNREMFSAYKNRQGVWVAPDPRGVGQCFIPDQPTHWRPLPEPPKNANE